MSNLEQEVTSLEISKQMREKGFPQESIWYWAKENERDEKHILWYETEYEEYAFQDGCSAFTTDELLKWVPDNFYITKAGDIWGCSTRPSKKLYPTTTSIRPCEAVAKNLLHLAGQGIINPKELG